MGIPPPVYLDVISMPDTLILMVLALVVFGPRRLPKIGRQLGKLMYEFRKASNDFKFQMEEELRQAEESDRRQKEEEERKRALAATPPAPQLEQSTTTAVEQPTPATQPELPAAPEPAPYTYEQPQLRFPELSPESAPLPEPDQNAATQTGQGPEPMAPNPPDPATTESSLQVRPPSTGEKVTADRPGQQPAQNPAADDAQRDAGAGSDNMTPEVERSEPATRHG
jgi:sec-independent protein translocase protein TatB